MKKILIFSAAFFGSTSFAIYTNVNGGSNFRCRNYFKSEWDACVQRELMQPFQSRANQKIVLRNQKETPFYQQNFRRVTKNSFDENNFFNLKNSQELIDEADFNLKTSFKNKRKFLDRGSRDENPRYIDGLLNPNYIPLEDDSVRRSFYRYIDRYGFRYIDHEDYLRRR